MKLCYFLTNKVVNNFSKFQYKNHLRIRNKKANYSLNYSQKRAGQKTLLEFQAKYCKKLLNNKKYMENLIQA